MPLHSAPSQLARSICHPPLLFCLGRCWPQFAQGLYLVLHSRITFSLLGASYRVLGIKLRLVTHKGSSPSATIAPVFVCPLLIAQAAHSSPAILPQGLRFLESENWPLPGAYVFSLHYSWPFLRTILPCHLLSSFGMCYCLRVSVNFPYLSWYSAINLSMGTAFTPAQFLFCHL